LVGVAHICAEEIAAKDVQMECFRNIPEIHTRYLDSTQGKTVPQSLCESPGSWYGEESSAGHGSSHGSPNPTPKCGAPVLRPHLQCCKSPLRVRLPIGRSKGCELLIYPVIAQEVIFLHIVLCTPFGMPVAPGPDMYRSTLDSFLEPRRVPDRSGLHCEEAA